MLYLPPPAQAQAQPAQAQAQAQPPPERPPPLPDLLGGGTGLVTLVMPRVKSLTLPRTLPEKFWTPPTTDAAKSAPGREARPPEPDVMEGMEGTEDWW